MARLEDRADALGEKADRKASAADALHDRAHRMADAIPFGQPILVGHHSEKRDRNYRAKMVATMDRAGAATRDARETERRAIASEANLRHRESVPTTLRRIERLEAEARGIIRSLTPCRTSGRRMKEGSAGRVVTCPACYHDQTVGADCAFPVHGAATGDYAARLEARGKAVADEVGYWRDRVAEAEEAGVKVWGPADFKPGDLVHYWNGWRKVVRVNAKTLSVETAYSWTDKVKYDEVRGQRGPEVPDA